MWAATWQNQQNECASSEDSDQPGHPPSLIRVFAVHMKKAWVLSYPLSAQWRLSSDWADARLIWVFTGRTVTLLVLSCRGSYDSCILLSFEHEIMALFVLCKLILQTRMRSYPVGLDVWVLVGPFIYFHTSCVRTAKALARLRRLAWAFTGHLRDKYHNLMSKLFSSFSAI